MKTSKLEKIYCMEGSEPNFYFGDPNSAGRSQSPAPMDGPQARLQGGLSSKSVSQKEFWATVDGLTAQGETTINAVLQARRRFFKSDAAWNDFMSTGK